MTLQLAGLDPAVDAPLFERLSAPEVLRRVVDAYAPDVALSCSFGGPGGLVLLDLLARQDLLDDVEVYFLDTGLLFDATHELRERLERRYGFETAAYVPEITVADQAARFGANLWERDPDACCALRKVGPNALALEGKRAWITGIRRDQSPRRAATSVIEWNQPLGLLKVAPLCGWTDADVWDYVDRRGVPYNRLHDAGYPSLGCNTVCTTRGASMETLRAGRWRGLAKTECGLHGSV